MHIAIAAGDHRAIRQIGLLGRARELTHPDRLHDIGNTTAELVFHAAAASERHRRTRDSNRENLRYGAHKGIDVDETRKRAQRGKHGFPTTRSRPLLLTLQRTRPSTNFPGPRRRLRLLTASSASGP
jgi:hypothetical protein